MSENLDEDKIRRALTWSLGIGAGFVVLVGLVFWLLDEPLVVETIVDHEATGPQRVPTGDIATPALRFTDVTKAAGIDFVHVNGAYGERLLPETMGGGVAFFDYDNDGDQDLFFVNSSSWPGHGLGEATSRLYRNRGDGTFDDVSVETATDLRAYGMGVAAGDYDADGFVDLFVTAVGANRLLRNLGGQRFEDATGLLGDTADEASWSTSAAFFDYDRDGDLDLYVANYVQWSPEIDRAVDYRLAGIGRAYGPPTDFAGTQSRLYRNDIGQGRFTDVSTSAGIEVVNPTNGQPVGKALAVHPVDVDADGWLDLIVANDTVRNFLFINERNGRFRESGVDAGIAFDTAGLATGAMGVDAAFYANDERLGVVIGNFANEMSSFYVVRGASGVFSDDAIVAGIGAPSRRALTFGLMFVDVDLDGRQDVFAVNGHVEPDINKVQASQHYAQPTQLFWNCGDACGRDYRLVEQSVGEPLVGRGAAFADIDDDGDLDVVVTSVGGAPQLLRNDTNTGHDWVRMVLRDKGLNKNAIGAEVTLTQAGRMQKRSVMPARSYLSQVELPVTFGLGDTTDQYVTVEVTWPDGQVETWRLQPNQTHELARGRGIRAEDL